MLTYLCRMMKRIVLHQQIPKRVNSRISRLTGFFIMCAMLIIFPYSVQASDSVSYQNLKIGTSGGQRSVQAVYVNLKDPAIKVESALAGGRVGQADQMGKIAESVATQDTEVVAAINGTFFSAYNGVPLPWGTIQTKGRFVHLGNIGTAIGFSRSNRVYMESLFVSIKGSTNGSYEWPNNWYAWCFNHPTEDPSSIVIYTPTYGNQTPVHAMRSVVVDNNRVVEVISGQARIPANGYTIVLGDQEMLKRFSPGTQVEYKTEFNVTSFNPPKPGAPLDWNDAYTTIGAGPRLLKNGQIVANGAAEGFVEDKITKNRGQRSFIGVKADQTLIMGTVANVNMYELAEIAKHLGLSDAMNLDGGASSGLIFKGKYITTPGRMLSNALVITRQKAGAVPPIVVLLDDKQLSFDDVSPLVQDDRTLVPVRAIFEAMGASIQWDAQTETVTAKKEDKTVVLRVGDRQAMIDNESRTLDVAAQIINGRVMVPLRFVAEAFGARVSWSPSSQVIHIDTN